MNKRILALACVLLVAVFVIGCGRAAERQQEQQPSQQAPSQGVPTSPDALPIPPAAAPVSPGEVPPVPPAIPAGEQAGDDLLDDPSSASEPADPSLLPADSILPEAPTG